MAEKRSKPGEAGQAETAGSGGKQKSRRAESSRGATAGDAVRGKGRGTYEQIGSIFSKVLELAETGVGLGVNLLSRLSSHAQGEAAHKQGGDVRQWGGDYPPPHPDEMGAGMHSYPQDHHGDTRRGMGASWNHFVTNRMPLHTGSPFQISFSINNDSDASEKKLHLEAEDFFGATTGFRLDRRLFSVDPAEKAIAPRDFDKFVLAGAIPVDALEDTYNGWILITGDEEIRLPVTLMVGPHPA